jgi:hypothetical protein
MYHMFRSQNCARPFGSLPPLLAQVHETAGPSVQVQHRSSCIRQQQQHCHRGQHSPQGTHPTWAGLPNTPQLLRSSRSVVKWKGSAACPAAEKVNARDISKECVFTAGAGRDCAASKACIVGLHEPVALQQLLQTHKGQGAVWALPRTGSRHAQHAQLEACCALQVSTV